jgi:hypothetical protein
LSDDDGSLTGLVDTVSVNKDHFFNAPRETAECASDVADNMPPPLGTCAFGDSELCATAKTSPYSYLTTVVYPDCARQPNGCPALSPWQPVQDYNRAWSKECDNQYCFGVKLYRMDLVNGEDPAHPPYIRMAGQSLYQRSTLTVNHGKYYMDTTVSSATQIPWLIGGQGSSGCRNGDADRQANPKDGPVRGPCTFENVFTGGSTYYLFFLYAKPKPASGDGQYTKQDYSLYVGPGFDPTNANQLFMTRVDRSGGTYGFNSDHTNAVPCTNGSTTNCFNVDPPTQANNYVLTVHVDASHLPNFLNESTAEKKAVCGPKAYCSWNDSTSSCGCKDGSTDSECAKACSWSGNDLSCPSGGCYGFGFKLPDNFVANDTPAVPSGSCLKSNDPDWQTQFTLYQPWDNNDACNYAGKTLTEGFCTSGKKPNPNLQDGSSE